MGERRDAIALTDPNSGVSHSPRAPIMRPPLEDHEGTVSIGGRTITNQQMMSMV